MLDMKAVQEECIYYMQGQLDNTNCFAINSFAEAHSLEEMEETSMRYIIGHFGDVYTQVSEVVCLLLAFPPNNLWCVTDGMGQINSR